MVVVEWIYPQKILRITSKYLTTKEVEQRITGSSRGVLGEKIPNDDVFQICCEGSPCSVSGKYISIDDSSNNKYLLEEKFVKSVTDIAIYSVADIAY